MYVAKDGVCSNEECTGKLAVFCVALFLALAGYFMCDGINMSATIRYRSFKHTPVLYCNHQHMKLMFLSEYTAKAENLVGNLMLFFFLANEID